MYVQEHDIFCEVIYYYDRIVIIVMMRKIKD